MERLATRRNMPYLRFCDANMRASHINKGPPLPVQQVSAIMRSFSDNTTTTPSSNFVPYIIEQTKDGGERVYDIYSRLLKERIVFVQGQVHDAMSSAICAQLLFLESQNKSKPVQMYINSPGGVVTAGLAIYDTMQYISCPVHTLVIGQACSMGSLLLAAGESGQRRALPHARVMVHQPSGGSQGQATDILIQAEEISRLKTLLSNIYATHCGMELNEVLESLERDNFMTPQEAQTFGIIDAVVTSRTES